MRVHICYDRIFTQTVGLYFLYDSFLVIVLCYVLVFSVHDVKHFRFYKPTKLVGVNTKKLNELYFVT